MPFGKKSSNYKHQRGSESQHGLAAGKKNMWDSGWQQNDADDGLPGTCGYFRGIKGESHPSRFKYVRPDGKSEDEVGQERDPDTPLRPSQRSVPKGFFG